MKNLQIKIITGFRKDQYYTISAEEAHKAYHLFLNPEKRGIFKNGVALKGENIQGIEPDYNATMGWNADHLLQGEDWNEIKSLGVDMKLKQALIYAREVASKEVGLDLPLSEAVVSLPNKQPEVLEAVKKLSESLSK